jgi:hypothetical protein
MYPVNVIKCQVSKKTAAAKNAKGYSIGLPTSNMPDQLHVADGPNEPCGGTQAPAENARQREERTDASSLLLLTKKML